MFTVNLLFRPDVLVDLEPSYATDDLLNRNNKRESRERSGGFELQQDSDGAVTATEKRHSSLLLEEAARHIQEVARQLQMIDQVWSQEIQ